MRVWYLTSVTLHIVAACVWIGSMVFLAAVLVPVLRRPDYADVRTSLFHRTGIGLRYVGWTSLSLLVVTGIINLGYRGFGWADLLNGALWRGPWGDILGWKLALVGLVIGISFVHDFVLGPRTMTALEKAPDAVTASRIRRRASLLGRIVLLLSLIILVLAVRLVR